MTSMSPIHRTSSPGSSNEDQDQTTTPPLAIPPEIRIFQQENGNDKGYINNNNNIDHHLHQTPTINAKKSFCIDALLAKSKNDENIENEIERHKRAHNQYINNNNNNYKDNVISRDLNSSPDDNLSR